MLGSAARPPARSPTPTGDAACNWGGVSRSKSPMDLCRKWGQALPARMAHARTYLTLARPVLQSAKQTIVQRTCISSSPHLSMRTALREGKSKVRRSHGKHDSHFHPPAFASGTSRSCLRGLLQRRCSTCARWPGKLSASMADADLQHGEAALRSNDKVAAARYFQSALKQNPHTAEAFANLGALAFFAGDCATAEPKPSQRPAGVSGTHQSAGAALHL